MKGRPRSNGRWLGALLAMSVVGCGSSSEPPAAPMTAQDKGAVGEATTSDGGEEQTLATAGPITSADLGAAGGKPLPRCDDDTLEVNTSTRARAEAAAVCVINKLRRRRGRRALKRSSQLYQAAQRHASDMVSREYFSHTGNNGSSMVSRVRATGYLEGAGTWKVGENLAWGAGAISTARAIVQGWMNSPGHRRNLLQRRYRDAGLAVVVGAPAAGISSSMNAGTYAQEFGARK